MLKNDVSGTTNLLRYVDRAVDERMERVAAANVTSVATRRFGEMFGALPGDVQSLAVKNYHLLSPMAP